MDPGARRRHQVSSSQLEVEEIESDEEILMTYSSDASVPQLQTTNSIPLIQFNSSEEDEPSLIASHTNNHSEDVQARPTPTSMLMLPSLSTTSPLSRDDIHQTDSDSDGRMASSAFHEIKAQAPAAQSAPMPPSPTTASLDPRPRPTFSAFQEATLEPITIVRTTSTPTKLVPKRQVISPSWNGSQSRTSSPVKRSLKNSYSLRKQMSLPGASRDGLPLLLAPEGHSRKSSPTSITHEEMVQFARDVVAPRNRDDSTIFRRQTPTDFRRTTPPPSRQQSPKGQPDEIPRLNTDRTDKSDEELGGLEWTDSTDEISAISARRLPSNFFPTEIEDARGSPDSTSTYVNRSFFERKGVQYVYYMSTYACFGTIIRIFLERLFGYDCEFRSTNDWLSPLSYQICVTASGMTEQRGGALFVALPANVVGSFILGVLTVLKPSVWPPIPWLKADHPLQSHDALHAAIKTGMCGSLTTFSSWNSQMVIMLDGSQTVLGPQIASALCGYLLGTLAAVGSFCCGTHVSAWLNNWRNPIDVASERREGDPPRTIHYPRLDRRRSRLCNVFRVLTSGRNIGIVTLIVLTTLFLVGDVVFNSVFYRSVWMAVVCTPPGALLRWWLAVRYNGVAIRPGMDWLPVGTLAANIIGSCISILLLALQFRHFKDAGSSWPALILSAICDGTIASFTTVSTLVKELFEISTRFPNHAKAYYYCGITIGAAMFLSLIVCMPIVRSK